MIGTIAFAVAPGGILWRNLLHSWGLWWLLWIGLVDSALSEEFSCRRDSPPAFRNTGTGFVTATFFWACLHIPEFHTAGLHNTWLYAFLSALQIMPIGLLWGYLTHRTKSLLPAVLVHGFNFWGLQNFHG